MCGGTWSSVWYKFTAQKEQIIAVHLLGNACKPHWGTWPGLFCFYELFALFQCGGHTLLGEDTDAITRSLVGLPAGEVAVMAFDQPALSSFLSSIILRMLTVFKVIHLQRKGEGWDVR